MYVLAVLSVLGYVYAAYLSWENYKLTQAYLNQRVDYFNAQANLARAINIIESNKELYESQGPTVIRRLAQIGQDEDELIESQQLIVGNDQAKYLREVAELKKMASLKDLR